MDEDTLKGELAEQYIAELCSNAYMKDFCFRNPQLDGRELCDFLIILGEHAIIWQIKNLKLSDGKLKQKEVDKAIRQCHGAKRKLLAHQAVTFSNISNEKKSIDISRIKEVHLIAAIEGGIPNMHTDNQNGDKSRVHVFFSDTTKFALKYLNTVADLVEYLGNRSLLASKLSAQMILIGSEKDLMAEYLTNARTFGDLEQPNKADLIVLEYENAADKFESKQGVLERLEQDAIYGSLWDHLIDKQRAGIVYEDASPDITQEDRDTTLSTMMSHTALEKRMLGGAFLDAAQSALKAHKDSSAESRTSFRRYCPMAGVTYAFWFFEGSWKEDIKLRQSILYFISIAARVKFPDNHTVIGIATEIDMLEKSDCGYDWIHLIVDDDEKLLEELNEPATKEVLQKLGILTNPTMRTTQMSEYPNEENLTSNGPIYKGRIEVPKKRDE